MKKTKKILKLLKSECGQCSSCCRNIIVDVTSPDIERLLKHTRLPADKLVRLYSSSDIDSREENDWIKLSYGKRSIGLNKKRNGDCIFLSNDKMCMVYDARPMTCRIFPLTRILDEKDYMVNLEISDVITDKTIKCKRSKGNSRSYKSFMATAELARKEYAVFKQHLSEWNSLPDKGMKNDFLDFLRLKASKNGSKPAS